MAFRLFRGYPDSRAQAEEAFNVGDYKKASKILSKAIKLAPLAPDIFYFRAMCFINLQEWDKAIRDLRQCIQLGLDPSTKAEHHLAKCLFHNSEYDESISIFNDLIEKHPSGFGIITIYEWFELRGMALCKTGKFLEAEQDLKRALAPLDAGYNGPIIYWLLVCKHRGDERKASIEQMNLHKSLHKNHDDGKRPLLPSSSDESLVRQSRSVHSLLIAGDIEACVNLGEAAVESIISETKNASSDIRKLAVRALIKMKLEDTRVSNAFIAALKDSNSEVRIWAIKGLLWSWDSLGIEPIYNILKDDNYEVRIAAMEALWRLIHNTKYTGPREHISKAFTEALRDESKEVRSSAFRALHDFRDKSAIEPLINLFLNSDEETKVSAMLLLGDLNVIAYEYLIETVRRKKSRLAIEQLGNMKDIRAVEPLIIILRDMTYKDVHAEAATALGKIKYNRAVEALLESLEYDDYWVRANSAIALGEIKDKRAVEPLIKALDDKEEKVRWDAARALGEIKDVRAVAPLIAKLKDDKILAICARSLGNIGDVSSAEFLIAISNDEDRYVRACVVKALGCIKDHRAFDTLIAALKDKESSVRAEAAWSLGEIGDNHALEPLLFHLKYTDKLARESDIKQKDLQINIEPEARDRYIALANELRSYLLEIKYTVEALEKITKNSYSEYLKKWDGYAVGGIIL